jgi:Zn-finger nucleic acid-binding protein
MRSPETVAGMLCPVCKTGLAMSDRQGVEIDYCPSCRGVWLDRGELDKIIERSGVEAAPVPPQPPQTPQTPQPPYPPQQGYAPPPAPWGGGYEQRGYDPRYKQKRKKSFFEELFD